MLRHPFLRLFGPIFSPFFPSGNRTNRTSRYHSSRRSYVLGVALPSRNTNRGSVALGSEQKHDPFGPEEFVSTTSSVGPYDLDEEERTLESRGSAYVPSAGHGYGPGIVVKKDVIVERSDMNDERKTVCTDATQIVRDDKDSGMSTYMHV